MTDNPVTEAQQTVGLRVVVASDQAGVAYRRAIIDMLSADDRILEVFDQGVRNEEDSTAYPHVAVAAARRIVAGEADRGIFICGTGMGVAIAANKVEGIRASTAHDSYSVERLVKSNNAQVLCLGQRVIGLELALRLAHEFVTHVFDPQSPSAEKVEVLSAYDHDRGGGLAGDGTWLATGAP